MSVVRWTCTLSNEFVSCQWWWCELAFVIIWSNEKSSTQNFELTFNQISECHQFETWTSILLPFSFGRERKKNEIKRMLIYHADIMCRTFIECALICLNIKSIWPNKSKHNTQKVTFMRAKWPKHFSVCVCVHVRALAPHRPCVWFTNFCEN